MAKLDYDTMMSINGGPKRIAIVHDYLTQFGGAERVLLALMELFPNAPVFTLLYDRDGFGVPIDESRLRLSFLQKIPGARRNHRHFPLLMPLAMEQFDFSDYDMVFSSTHSFGKGIITSPRTMHVSYCFTPTRYAWDDSHRYIREFSRLALFRWLAPAGLSYIRLWDFYAAQRVDVYLTLSHFVAGRIKKYYHRQAIVIPPPVEVEKFSRTSRPGEYYLIVSRLVPYKRIDIAIEACEKIGRPLKIVGHGPERELLAKRTGKLIEFVGFVSDEKLAELYAGARALLFPQEEDFGLTPLEAAAAGKPTVAYASGGALETVIHGETGLFFYEQTAAALADTILDLEQRTFYPERIKEHAAAFSKNRFLQEIAQVVEREWQHYKTRYQTRV